MDRAPKSVPVGPNLASYALDASPTTRIQGNPNLFTPSKSVALRARTPEEVGRRLDDLFGKTTNEEVAEKVSALGVETSKESVRRYRNGAKSIPSDFVAAAALILDTELGPILWVSDAESAEDATPRNALGEPKPSGGVGEVDWMAELYRRYDAIEALDIPEWQKMMKADVLMGLIREEGRRQAEVAATARASAARREIETAAERVRTLRERGTPHAEVAPVIPATPPAERRPRGRKAS